MKRTIAMLVLAALLVGCEDTLNVDYTQPSQLEQGIVYILPGIQGIDSHYANIRKGLTGAGIHCAIKIHAWGSQLPIVNLSINETDVAANRDWGRKIAAEIIEYQQQYPGRPIFLIGQSGGAGVSVFTAEALVDLGGDPINGLILLDASLSADYDLSKAMSICHQGIVNFYNEQDVAMLQFGTGLMGNVDGGHGASAGCVGISGSFPRLFQVQVTGDMADDYATNPHFADCSQGFASLYIAPWIIDRTWPPPHVPANP